MELRKRIGLIFGLLFPLMVVAQNQLFIEDITQQCRVFLNDDGTHTIEVDSHKLIAPRGSLKVIHANRNDLFLNIYCLGKYNELYIFTSKLNAGKWEQYGGYEMMIPNLDISNSIVKNFQVPDINTAHIVYEVNGKELKSYVIRLTESGYAIYNYLNDPILDFRDKSELEKYQKRISNRKIENRPKF